MISCPVVSFRPLLVMGRDELLALMSLLLSLSGIIVIMASSIDPTTPPRTFLPCSTCFLSCCFVFFFLAGLKTRGIGDVGKEPGCEAHDRVGADHHATSLCVETPAHVGGRTRHGCQRRAEWGMLSGEGLARSHQDAPAPTRGARLVRDLFFIILVSLYLCRLSAL